MGRKGDEGFLLGVLGYVLGFLLFFLGGERGMLGWFGFFFWVGLSRQVVGGFFDLGFFVGLVFWPFLVFLVVYQRSPLCGAGTYFLCRRKESRQRKRLTPLTVKRGPRSEGPVVRYTNDPSHNHRQ